MANPAALKWNHEIHRYEMSHLDRTNILTVQHSTAGFKKGNSEMILAEAFYDDQNVQKNKDSPTKGNGKTN